MAARARCGDRLMKHRRDGKIPYCSSSRRHRGFNPTPTLALQRSECRFAVPRECVRTKSHVHGSDVAFDLRFRSEFAATDAEFSARRHQSLCSDSIGNTAFQSRAALRRPDDCRCGPSRNADGALCVAVRCEPANCRWAASSRRSVRFCSEVLQRGLAARA
jgi:hypothetical protein